LGPQAPLEILVDQQVPLVFKDLRERLVYKERPVQQGLALPALQVYKDPLELPEFKELRDPLVYRVQRD
jgi:hypothetical protein